MKIKRSDKCLAFGCFNPQRIKNPYTGEIFYTSCNHCVACLNAKATKYSLRVENEVKQNKYSIYFTLTYSNYAIPRIIESVKTHVFENGCEVPRLFVNSNPDFVDGICQRVAFGRSLDPRKVIRFPIIQDDQLQSEFDDIPTTGVVSRSDIQKFLKRLRNRLNFRYEHQEDRKFRYFIASEYGPNTFRPHYHGILFTDSDRLATDFEELLRESWPFDNPDRHKVSFVEGGASAYVANYINSVADLPQILQTPAFRPFVLQSKNPLIGYKKEDRKAVRKRVYNSDFTEQRVDASTGAIVVSQYPKQVLDRFFCDFPFSFDLSVEDRVSLFSKENWSRFLGGDESCLPSDFVKRLKFSLGSFGYLNMLKERAFGMTLGKILKKYCYPVYHAYKCGWIECSRYCRYKGLPFDFSHYVRLLDSIKLCYFNFTMRKFYDAQNNFLTLSPTSSVVRFYPNVFDLVPRFSPDSDVPFYYEFGKDVWLPSDIYAWQYTDWSGSSPCPGNLDDRKLWSYIFPHDSIYNSEKLKQLEIHRKKLMKKKHSDSKYHALDQNLYSDLNFNLQDYE